MTDSQPFTSADIKRTVKDSNVYVNMVGGKAWMTDSYWAAPITHQLADFAAAYGISAEEPGAYFVDNGKQAHTTGKEAPNLERIIPADFDKVGKEETFAAWHEVFPTRTAQTGNALVFANPDSPAVLLEDEGQKRGTAAGVEFLRVLSGGSDCCTQVDDERHLTFSVKTSKNGRPERRRVRIFAQDGAARPMAVIVEYEMSSTRANTYETSRTWFEMFRAVLMPVKVG